MDTKELLAARDQLQKDMRISIASLVEKFETDSGIGVSDISIEMLDVSTMIKRHIMVASVTVKLEIE